MIFILANDAQLARMWAADQNIPDSEWRVATPGALKAFPSGSDGDHRLVVLEGAEMSPEYSLIFDLATDRGIQASTVAIHSDRPPVAANPGAD